MAAVENIRGGYTLSGIELQTEASKTIADIQAEADLLDRVEPGDAQPIDRQRTHVGIDHPQAVGQRLDVLVETDEDEANVINVDSVSNAKGKTGLSLKGNAFFILYERFRS